MTISTDNDPSTNGSGASRMNDAADIFADLAALRLMPDEAGQIGSEEVLAHVSVRKPSINEFVRVNPDPAMSLATSIFVDPERETYFVAPGARTWWPALRQCCYLPPSTSVVCFLSGRSLLVTAPGDATLGTTQHARRRNWPSAIGSNWSPICPADNTASIGLKAPCPTRYFRKRALSNCCGSRFAAGSL